MPALPVLQFGIILNEAGGVTTRAAVLALDLENAVLVGKGGVAVDQEIVV